MPFALWCSCKPLCKRPSAANGRRAHNYSATVTVLFSV
jgi:hypothetical protein